MFRVSLEALFVLACGVSGYVLAGIHAGVGPF